MTDQKATVREVGCPRCHGEDWIEEYGAACGTCRGFGSIEVVDVEATLPPSPEPEPEPVASCARCGGEGAVDSSEDVGPSGLVTCPRCAGSGDSPRGTRTRVSTPGRRQA